MPAIWLQPFVVIASHLACPCVLARPYAASERRFRRVGETAVQRRYHLRALADRAADALDRAGADVADREHAGHRGFQRRPPAGWTLRRLRRPPHTHSP